MAGRGGMSVTKRAAAPASSRRIATGMAGRALSAAGLLGGCQNDGTTSVRVAVTWGALSVDQLEFTVLPADLDVRDAIVPATVRPAQPAAAPLSSGQDV